MAVRSGAGTGVVVSLVVFILTTIFLLILTIVFYSGQSKERQATADANRVADVYVKRAERSREPFKSFEAAASSAGDSVAGYLHGRTQELMAFVDGSPTTSVEEMKSAFARMGVDDDQVVREKLEDTQRRLDDANTEIDGYRTQLQGAEDRNAELLAQVDQHREALRTLRDEVESELSTYRDAAQQYRQQLDDAVTDFNDNVDRITASYEGRITDFQDEIDQLSSERVVLIRRIEDLESKVRQSQISAQKPELLVDGRVIDSVGANDQVFIDRGRRHHIVLGMKFEVFDDSSALAQIDRVTGQPPRGKASLEVIKVGETTSTCKVTRSVPGRPVVREDVIANAVYDPRYQYKFMIHGKYDIDGDGRPTAGEADYLRSLVMEWGGTVIDGEQLPGDLDFLVLGAEPPQPMRLRSGANAFETEIWIKKKQEHDTYMRLFEQATKAQIPVLNANRFFILTGFTGR